MKFDYTKQFQMLQNVPNLGYVFRTLKPVATNRKKAADKIGFLFFMFCGTLFLYNVTNVSHHRNALDYSNGFRILPDYMTGSVFIGYRKERKQFILY
jgi:hypothetical protein